MYLGKVKNQIGEHKFLELRSIEFWNDGNAYESERPCRFVYETDEAKEYFVPYAGKISQSEITLALLGAN